MKAVRWDTGKNIRLISERGVSFEDVLSAMMHGGLLDTIEHPRGEKYPNQRMFIVRIREYVYLVPFVENDIEVFLKTIIPSRKATRIYMTNKAN
ncbi:MAG: BrnT family toxin [Magnetococcus sp. DMHC-1]|nr:BrnT family toxin [Magnetococcales bacterium]